MYLLGVKTPQKAVQALSGVCMSRTHDLPLKLVLFRLIQGYEHPMHWSEIAKDLKLSGYNFNDMYIQNKLSEMSRGYPKELKIKLVVSGVYIKET